MSAMSVRQLRAALDRAVSDGLPDNAPVVVQEAMPVAAGPTAWHVSEAECIVHDRDGLPYLLLAVDGPADVEVARD